jgi:5-methylcytosine-specific restriction endonuclease McrA
LAIPQKFGDLFPREKSQIQVVFDDEENARALTFRPYDSVVKENRIFGLRRWFTKREVREGDLISITIEDPAKQVYRVALNRFVQERQEHKARQNLRAARTDSEAEQQLTTLSRLTKRRPREVAENELLLIAQHSANQPRPTVLPSTAARNQIVPAGLRVLVREMHDGKCQLCSFTFEKRNGEPYFEVHHLDPSIGHHPTNLLVVCPNCHAQFEHAVVTDPRWASGWLVGVTINGKRLSVRQPLAHDSNRRALFGLLIIMAAARMSRLVLR